jgi:hypothetical protein
MAACIIDCTHFLMIFYASSSGYRHAQYFIKKQAENMISLGPFILIFLKHVLLLAVHTAQHIVHIVRGSTF